MCIDSFGFAGAALNSSPYLPGSFPDTVREPLTEQPCSEFWRSISSRANSELCARGGLGCCRAGFGLLVR